MEREDVSRDEVSRSVVRSVWGLLLIWVGMALLLGWSWGVGLLGGGLILLGAEATRRRLRLEVDRVGLVAGALLAVCGLWNMLGVTVDLVPLLAIAAGVFLLVSVWTGRSARRAPGGSADLHAPTPPRA